MSLSDSQVQGGSMSTRVVLGRLSDVSVVTERVQYRRTGIITRTDVLSVQHRHGESQVSETRSTPAQLRAKARYRERNREEIRVKNREYSKQYRAAHPEKIKNYNAKYLMEHPEYFIEARRNRYAADPEAARAARRQQYWADPEAGREVARASRARNPDAHRESAKRWQRTNRDAALATQQRRRARQVNAEGRWTAAEWAALKARYGYRCLMCGQSEPIIKLTVDHVVPLVCGGTHYISNIQPLCRTCNSRKHARILDLRPDVVEVGHAAQ